MTRYRKNLRSEFLLKRLDVKGLLDRKFLSFLHVLLVCHTLWMIRPFSLSTAC